MHAFEPAELPFRFFGDFLRHLRLLDLSAILLDFFLQFVAFAKLLLDRLHLLPQIELALALVDFAARLRVDVVLDFENFDFLGQQFVNAAKPLDRIDQFENLLRLVDFQIEIGCDQIRQTSGIVEIRSDRHKIRRKVFPERDRSFRAPTSHFESALRVRRNPAVTCGSAFGCTFAVRYGFDSSKYSTFARENP